MAFKPLWTEEAAVTFQKLQAAALTSLENRKRKKNAKASKAEGLFKQVEKCVRLLLENSKHLGLQTHAYDSIESPYAPNERVFEACVQNRTPGAYRLFCCYGPAQGVITIIAITEHP